jgi:acylphosphatase
MAKRMELIARRYVVRGRVQGVGYRYFAQAKAEETGVQGWVRNCDDGSVEAYAMGEPGQVNAFAGYLHQGPRFGEVRSVQESEAPLLQSRGFSIKH